MSDVTSMGRPITVHRSGAYATTTGAAPPGSHVVPPQPGVPVRESLGYFPRPVVRDLRDRARRGPRRLVFAASDVVVVSGLPGSGKSTLMRRAVAGPRVDSQDTRDRWAARMPRLLPYALYRPLVRVAHYAGLHRALRSGAGVVVHDCGTQPWVRRWLGRAASRRGATLHLLLLDVPVEVALDGQRERGRGVSRYAFARHRRTVGRLVRAAERGALPRGCGSAVLLDREAAGALREIGFEG
ncbi:MULTISPECIES: AAA family ATPase [Streptomyces]|uniref:AAA family ATPase n=1 Tax=Streptomyces TaxID=1883 RepID=UPI001F44912E|nr:AAA family ATPase [Streptomyces alboflavus]